MSKNDNKDTPSSSDKAPAQPSTKSSAARNTAIGAAATIGSAAIAAALLYAGRRFAKRSPVEDSEGEAGGTVPSGENPETD
ncbi:MAG: hypothetical protein AAF127_10540 [Pseudomonadota bacterium]